MLKARVIRASTTVRVVNALIIHALDNSQVLVTSLIVNTLVFHALICLQGDSAGKLNISSRFLILVYWPISGAAQLFLRCTCGDRSLQSLKEHDSWSEILSSPASRNQVTSINILQRKQHFLFCKKCKVLQQKVIGSPMKKELTAVLQIWNAVLSDDSNTWLRSQEYWEQRRRRCDVVSAPFEDVRCYLDNKSSSHT